MLLSNGLVLREKKPGGARERPKFIYRLIKTLNSKAAHQPSIVAMEFSNLRKACRYEKGRHCKLAKDACSAQNCRLIIKPK